MPPISTFIGRDDERGKLVDLVATRRMVTIVGPGGIGKTRLATEVCTEVASRFEGGVRRCELAALAPRDDIALEVAGMLGFRSLDALAVAMGDASTLLFLDNCEHVLGAAAAVCRQLLESVRALHVVATSREPLAIDGEHLLVLGPLALPAAADRDEIARAPATRLFEDRARASGGSWDLAPEQLGAIVELCRRLDGVPLAIELAAARSRSMTAVELLARLDRRFDLLSRAGPVGRARHRSLRAAIDTSYELLDPVEQTCFRGLGVFAGPFDAGLAHAVTAPASFDQVASLDMLSRLVDRSLVTAVPQAGATRYRLLDSLRHYALEQAAAAGESARLEGRFVDAMVAEADRLVATGLARWSADALSDVLTQFGNLVAALELCLVRDADATRAFRLLLPMWGAVHQGRAPEVAAVSERLLARFPDGEEPLRAEACAVAATAQLVTGRLERTRELAAVSLALPSLTAIPAVVAERALGIAACHAGDRGGAARSFLTARDAAVEADLRPFERELSAFAASIIGADGDLPRALDMLEQVVASAVRDEEPISEIWARLVMAQLFLGADSLAEARTALETARRLHDDFEYPYGRKVGMRLDAALTALESGWESSRARWNAAVDHLAAVGDLAELAVTLSSAAACALRAGDDAAARTLLDAVPRGVHVTVLGLLEHELVAARSLTGATGATGASAAAPGDALRRVRAVLGAAGGEDRGGAATSSPHASPADARTAQATSAATQGALTHVGDGWVVEFGGRSIQLRRLKGIEDLAFLLARPEHEVHCLELMGGIDLGDGGPSIDDGARGRYQARIRDLQEEIDESRAANDVLRAERAEAELDALVQQLSEAFGLGGRARRTGSSSERARSAVTWRVRAAIKRVAELHPELGRHLLNSVRTGSWCCYRPEMPVRWQITSR